MSPDLCFSDGLEAYRQGDFSKAVELFLQGLNLDKAHWEMHLYLGMAYTRQGNVREAKQEFLAVRDFAMDPELRRKANAALSAMSPTGSQIGMKKASGN